MTSYINRIRNAKFRDPNKANSSDAAGVSYIYYLDVSTNIVWKDSFYSHYHLDDSSLAITVIPSPGRRIYGSSILNLNPEYMTNKNTLRPVIFAQNIEHLKSFKSFIEGDEIIDGANMCAIDISGQLEYPGRIRAGDGYSSKGGSKTCDDYVRAYVSNKNNPLDIKLSSCMDAENWLKEKKGIDSNLITAAFDPPCHLIDCRDNGYKSKEQKQRYENNICTPLVICNIDVDVQGSVLDNTTITAECNPEIGNDIPKKDDNKKDDRDLFTKLYEDNIVLLISSIAFLILIVFIIVYKSKNNKRSYL